MIQLFGSVFGQEASTWNFGRSLPKAGAIESAQAKSDGAIFMSPSRRQRLQAGIAPMICFQYAAIKGYAVQYGRGQPSPISRKISAVCCPRRGDGCSEPAFQPSMTIGVRTPGMVPPLAESLGNSNFIPRWTTCGSLN